MPELETLAVAAAGSAGPRRGASATASTANSFAASLVDFSSPDATLDGRYCLRSIGHGAICGVPSGPAAQAMRTAVLTVPSIEWLADAMLPGINEAAAAADAAGLRSLPVAPLVADEADTSAAPTVIATPSSGSPTAADPAGPTPATAAAVAAAGGSVAAAAPAASKAQPLTTRFMTALGSFLGRGSTVDPAAQRAALRNAVHAVGFRPADAAAAYGLAPAFQVRIFGPSTRV